MKKTILSMTLLLGLAVVLGILRQFAPQGISWKGAWPSKTTKAEDAYKMVARPTDPPFISLENSIKKQSDPTVSFLDARSAVEYAAGHIPKARNLPFYELEQFQDSALQGLSSESDIVIYCEGIGCELSFFLARELQSAGYKNLHIFYGGYPEWKNAGLEIEK